MRSLLMICCLASITLARPGPAVYSDNYIDGNDYIEDGGHGGGGNIGGGGYGGGGHGYGGSSGGGGRGYEQAPVVQKHIYVHIAPQEVEYTAPQKFIPPPPPKIHYKIVFIKAPLFPTQATPAIPAPQQNQEKTLIYVLHKHAEDSPPIVIPTPQPTTPAKPEVYFIRYKTQNQLYAGPSHEGFDSSSTLSPVSSTLGHSHVGSTAVSILPHPSPSYSTTASYH